MQFSLSFSSPLRPVGLGVTALLTGAVLALAAPLSASAHVHVDPDSAEPGGYSVLTFRVPNESATASTTSVTVELPTDTPFSYVAYQPVPGWSAEVITETLPEPITEGNATLTEAPVRVVWTATGGGIADGQFELFPLSVGPVPEVGSLLLPTAQGYSDGTVVEWDEAADVSGAEPEHPAPVLYVTDAPPAEGHAHADAAGAEGAADGTDGTTVAVSGDASLAASASATSAAASLALGFGIGGFVLGAGALVVVIVVLRRRPVAAPDQAGTDEVGTR